MYLFAHARSNKGQGGEDGDDESHHSDSEATHSQEGDEDGEEEDIAPGDADECVAPGDDDDAKSVDSKRSSEVEVVAETSGGDQWKQWEADSWKSWAGQQNKWQESWYGSSYGSQARGGGSTTAVDLTSSPLAKQTVAVPLDEKAPSAGKLPSATTGKSSGEATAAEHEAGSGNKQKVAAGKTAKKEAAKAKEAKAKASKANTATTPVAAAAKKEAGGKRSAAALTKAAEKEAACKEKVAKAAEVAAAKATEKHEKAARKNKAAIAKSKPVKKKYPVDTAEAKKAWEETNKDLIFVMLLE
jgi:hypothetical protein